MNISNINNFNINKIQNKPIQKGFRQSSFVQKPDTFERNTNINFNGRSNRLKQYELTTEYLFNAGKNAQLSLNGQLASEGWAGKIADSVSMLWDSKNRAIHVQEDINNYNKQIADLKKSVNEDSYKDKFKEIFDVEYNQSNIRKYETTAKQFNMAVTTKSISDIVSAKLKNDLNIYNKNNGELKDFAERVPNYYASTGSVPFFDRITKKEDVLSNLENSLVSIIGSKETLDSTLRASGMNTQEMTDQEKYSAYGLMAKFLTETTKETSINLSHGKNIKELKKEYDEAYVKAYGTKNHIQERVDKYNRSQIIGAAAVRGATRAALGALVMLSAPEAGFARLAAKAATTAGLKVVVDGSDKLSSKKEDALDSKTLKTLVRSAAITGAEKFTIGTLNSILPVVGTGYEILDEVLTQTKDVAVETTVGMVGEKLKKGNWATNQIAPRMLISFVFNNLNTDNDGLDTLISMSKSSINQAMKLDKRGINLTKTVIEGTKEALKCAEFQNDKSFDKLRDLSINNPEEYTKMMVSVLDEVIKEHKNDDLD